MKDTVLCYFDKLPLKHTENRLQKWKHQIHIMGKQSFWHIYNIIHVARNNSQDAF